MAYGDAKEHEGQGYRGMKVGGRHLWTYPDGQWSESKVGPQRWDVAFTSLKRRRRRAPEGSGAEVGSGYHWLIVAHQWVGKMDANTYATHLEGSKHLLAFRKPGWKGWTTQQRGHTSARLRTILVLEQLAEELRGMTDEQFEDPRDNAALAGLLEQAASASAGRPAGPPAGPPRAEAVGPAPAKPARSRAGNARKRVARNGTRPRRVKRERRQAAVATRARPRSRR